MCKDVSTNGLPSVVQSQPPPIRHLSDRSLAGYDDPAGLAIRRAREAEAVNRRLGELPVAKELLSLVPGDHASVCWLVLRRDGHRQPQARSTKLAGHTLQQLPRLGLLIADQLGIGAKTLFDHRDVALLPPFATRAVASEDVSAPEDGLRLAATFLIGAVTLEDTEAVLVRRYVDDGEGLALELVRGRPDLHRLGQVLCQLGVQGGGIEQLWVLDVAGCLTAVVSSDHDIAASDHHRSGVFGQLDDTASGRQVALPLVIEPVPLALDGQQLGQRLHTDRSGPRRGRVQDPV